MTETGTPGTGLREHVAAGVADLGVLHFQPQVVALAGALAHAGEDGIAAVGAGDAGDQLGEDDGLAQAGPAEQTRPCRRGRTASAGRSP